MAGKKKKRRPVFCDTENYLKFKFWFPQIKFYWSATTLTYYRPSHTRSTVRAESLWRRRRNCKTWNTDYLAIYRKKSVTPSLEDYEIASRGLVLAWELTKVRTYLVTQALFVFLKVAIRKNCLPRISHIFVTQQWLQRREILYNYTFFSSLPKYLWIILFYFLFYWRSKAFVYTILSTSLLQSFTDLIKITLIIELSIYFFPFTPRYF